MLGDLYFAFSAVVPLRILRDVLIFSFNMTKATSRPPPALRTHLGPRTPSKIMASASQTGPKSANNNRVRYYAIRRGRDGFQGILRNWAEARAVTCGVSHSVFKSFKTLEAAHAYMSIPLPPTPNVVGEANDPPQPFSLPEPPNSSMPTRTLHTCASTGNTPSSNSTTPSFSKCELYNCTNPKKLAEDAPDPSDESPTLLVVYTDGACSNNGKPDAKAGYGIFFGNDNPYNVSEPLRDGPTNQRAEMTAVLEAMRITLDHGLVAKNGKVVICTDSQVCFYTFFLLYLPTARPCT